MLGSAKWRNPALLGLTLMVAGASSASLIGPGKPAPAWSAKTVAGKAISSTQFKGKVVLLNFFSYG